jgi:uncharacterized membrane protein YdjX (TVP38/TMEM64 family)
VSELARAPRDESRRLGGAPLRWTALVLVVLALILVPFALFGTQLDAWSTSFLEHARADAWLTRALVVALLASDIFLPVPSSAVSTFAGVSLGFWDGFITSTAGMSLGCVLGYAVGRSFGRQATTRFVGEDQMRRLEARFTRWGDWILVAARAVPVLAEASALVAGVGRMRAGRFFVITSFANAGISLVYAAVGAYAANLSSFLLAFTGAIVVPGVALLIERTLGRRAQQAPL